MDRTTRDREAILHHAGAHHLSPALDARGLPAFSAAPGDGLARCGWETFFAVLRRRGLAARLSDEAEVRFVAEAQVGGDHASLASALAHARRFWSAFVGPRAKAG